MCTVRVGREICQALAFERLPLAVISESLRCRALQSLSNLIFQLVDTFTRLDLLDSSPCGPVRSSRSEQLGPVKHQPAAPSESYASLFKHCVAQCWSACHGSHDSSRIVSADALANTSSCAMYKLSVTPVHSVTCLIPLRRADSCYQRAEMDRPPRRSISPRPYTQGPPPPMRGGGGYIDSDRPPARYYDDRGPPPPRDDRRERGFGGPHRDMDRRGPPGGPYDDPRGGYGPPPFDRRSRSPDGESWRSRAVVA